LKIWIECKQYSQQVVLVSGWVFDVYLLFERMIADIRLQKLRLFFTLWWRRSRTNSYSWSLTERRWWLSASGWKASSDLFVRESRWDCGPFNGTSVERLKVVGTLSSDLVRKLVANEAEEAWLFSFLAQCRSWIFSRLAGAASLDPTAEVLKVWFISGSTCDANARLAYESCREAGHVIKA